VKLVDHGPYRIIRHPQLLARFLIIFAVLAAGVDQSGAWMAVGSLSLSLVAVAIEEDALHQAKEWRRYSRRVKWRLCPGII